MSRYAMPIAFVALAACGDDDARADLVGGPVDCAQPNAYAVEMSEYDPEGACFLAAFTECYLSDDGPSGFGESVCAVRPDARVVALYLPFGVELPTSWHLDDGRPESDQDRRACEPVRQRIRASRSGDAGSAAAIELGMDGLIGPACEP